MTYIKSFDLDPFDLLWKDFFNTTSHFSDIATRKVTHPTDIYETETGIVIEVAVVGLDKKDIDIQSEGDVLRIKYNRPELDEKTAIYRGIKRGSFDLAWKIANKFDLSKLTATLEKGLLILEIPLSEIKAPKKIEIK